MARLVTAASISPRDSGFARLGYADHLASYFTTNAVLHLEAMGTDFPLINGRTDLLQAAMAAGKSLREAKFNLADLNVTFPPDKNVANAYVVITGQINKDTNHFGQAFRMVLQRSQGQWLIKEVNALPRPE